MSWRVWSCEYIIAAEQLVRQRQGEDWLKSDTRRRLMDRMCQELISIEDYVFLFDETYHPSLTGYGMHDIPAGWKPHEPEDLLIRLTAVPRDYAHQYDFNIMPNREDYTRESRF